MIPIAGTTGKTDLRALEQKRSERNQSFTLKPFAQKFQGAFAFDVTGSMFKYFDVCRKNIGSVASSVRERIPESEFSIGYFRNHGDEGRYGEISVLTPFLKGERDISRRIADIPKGGGGNDAKCCLEEALRAANSLAWATGSAKALVIIVDTLPNGVSGMTKKCRNGIEWSKEVDQLANKNVKIYPVFAGANEEVRDFYQKVSDRTFGRLIPLSDMYLMTDVLVAIAMKETGNLRAYLEDREACGKITNQQKRAMLLLEWFENFFINGAVLWPLRFFFRFFRFFPLAEPFNASDRKGSNGYVPKTPTEFLNIRIPYEGVRIHKGECHVAALWSHRYFDFRNRPDSDPAT